MMDDENPIVYLQVGLFLVQFQQISLHFLVELINQNHWHHKLENYRLQKPY